MTILVTCMVTFNTTYDIIKDFWPLDVFPSINVNRLQEIIIFGVTFMYDDIAKLLKRIFGSF